ncbi:prepilin peptidase [Planctomycetota bacterium]|nr:prepilin peptidase [Planctomycetota bacterium]
MFVLPLIAYCLLIAVVAIGATTDVKRGIVPNRLTYSAIMIGLIFWCISGVMGAEIGLKASAIGFAAGLVPFVFLYALGGLGGGDVKLMAAVGTLSASWQCVLSTTVYALFFAMLLCVIVMIKRKIAWQTLSRLFTAFLFARAGSKVSFEKPGAHIPFAAAIAFGALLAGAEQMLGLTTPWSWLNP